MTHGEFLLLLAEKTALERMIAETPEEDAIDRASLDARLTGVLSALTLAKPHEHEASRVRLTQGAPRDR